MADKVIQATVNTTQTKRKKRKRKKKKKTLTKNDTQAEKTMSKVQDTKNINELLEIAGGMWKKVKEVVKLKPEFMDIDDTKKLEFFREKLNYKEFMTEFPIMCRYMVCMGQYSRKAFKRFLDRVRVTRANCPPPGERPKGYMEDQWIRRQADYVKFLWEAYQKGHWDRREAQYIWEDAYKKLKGEFDDFRDKYEDIKDSREKEKDALKASNARDLLERLRSGKQKLNDYDSFRLMYLLKNRLYKKRYNDCMKAIINDVPTLKHTARGVGEGAPEEDETKKPKVRMIEHVDENVYETLPDKYKMTPNEQTSLPSVQE